VLDFFIKGVKRYEFFVKSLALYCSGNCDCGCFAAANTGPEKRRGKIILEVQNMKKYLVVLFAVFALDRGFAQTAQLNEVKPVIAGGDLVIQIADVSENAVFYPVDIEGIRLEVLAVKAPDGSIRTAFNTCQVCYASGRGFYKQQGTVLICQNCGNRFRMSQVEVRSGGCNPVPIFPQYKTVTDKTITVPEEFLKEAKQIFARWKRG
jgi:uncharacterized membrane protein